MDKIPKITLEKLNELKAQTEDKFTKALIESLKEKIILPKRNKFYETLDFERINTLVEREKNRVSLKEAEHSIKEEKVFVLKVNRVNYGKKTKTIEVKGDTLLCSLSWVIQDEFGLEPMHLYEFGIGKYKFGPKCDEWEEIFDILDNYRLDAAISFAGLNKGDKMGFLYDFGDMIRFKIEITAVRNVGIKNEQR